MIKFIAKLRISIVLCFIHGEHFLTLHRRSFDFKKNYMLGQNEVKREIAFKLLDPSPLASLAKF